MNLSCVCFEYGRCILPTQQCEEDYWQFIAENVRWCVGDLISSAAADEASARFNRKNRDSFLHISNTCGTVITTQPVMPEFEQVSDTVVSSRFFGFTRLLHTLAGEICYNPGDLRVSFKAARSIESAEKTAQMLTGSAAVHCLVDMVCVQVHSGRPCIVSSTGVLQRILLCCWKEELYLYRVQDETTNMAYILVRNWPSLIKRVLANSCEIDPSEAATLTSLFENTKGSVCITLNGVFMFRFAWRVSVICSQADFTLVKTFTRELVKLLRAQC
jgi:hypothetical protein